MVLRIAANSTPGFNAGVFVADMAAWDQLGITPTLLLWQRRIANDPKIRLFGGSQPIMLMAFYKVGFYYS